MGLWGYGVMGLWGYGVMVTFILYPLFPNLGYNSTSVILNKI
jgi:hypothetical protein